MERDELRRMSSTIDTLMDLGKKEEAEIMLSDALRASAHDPAYHLFFQAESAVYLQNDIRRRQRLLSAGLQQAPGDAFLLRNLAGGYLHQKRLSKARRLFVRALAAEPGDADTLRCLGLLCSLRCMETRAMEWYRQALAINPEDHDSMRQIGVSLSKLGKDRQAIAWYRRALERCGHDYDSMRQMGISHAMLGEYEASFDWLNRALEVNPNDGESRRNIRLAKRRQNRRDETILAALLSCGSRFLAVGWRRFVDRLLCLGCSPQKTSSIQSAALSKSESTPLSRP